MQKEMRKPMVSPEKAKERAYFQKLAGEIFERNGITPKKEDIDYIAKKLENINRIPMGADSASKSIGNLDTLVYIQGKGGKIKVDPKYEKTAKDDIFKRADQLCSDEVVDALLKCGKNPSDYWIRSQVTENWFNMPGLMPGIAKVLSMPDTHGIMRSADEMSMKRDSIVEAISKIANIYSDSATEIIGFMGKFKEDRKRLYELVFLFNSDNAKKTEISQFIRDHEKVTKALKEEYNIEHFGRYSIPCLLDMYGKIGKEPNTWPKALLAYARSDWNDAFYQDKYTIDTLREHYDVRIIESDNEDDFISFSEKMSRYGKFDFLAIAGHGEPTEIRLGNNEAIGNKALIDLSDKGIMGRLNKTLNHKNKNLSVALFSCSTGDPKTTGNIASMISANLEVPRIFAPDSPTAVLGLSFDSKGYISDIKYNKAKSEKYVKGMHVSEKKE